MKKIYLMLSCFIAFTASAQTLKLQSFEGAPTDNWGYVTNPATFNAGSDKWDTLSSLTSITTLPSDGTLFFGVQDLANPNGGTAVGDSGIIAFDTVHLNGTSANITFDYDIFGFDLNDRVVYELWADGVSVINDTLVEGANGGGVSASGTETVNIPASTDSIRFQIRVTQNGGTDYAGFDNIRVVVASTTTPSADSIVITEIMYNTPGADSVEFVEIQNIGSTTVDLTGYSFTSGITGSFPSMNLNPGGYIVFTDDSVGFFNIYGFSAYQWASGSLNNSGELVRIEDGQNNVIDSVNYDDGGMWPVEADGDGWSLILTDSTLDNNNGSNWCISGTMVPGYLLNGIQMYASPGASDTCYVAPVITNVPTYLISDVNNVDANGAADSAGVYCWVKGVVLGVNMSTSGLSFTIWDNEGLGVFDNSVISGYNVVEGDSVLIRGTIGQFAGLTQIAPDSIQLVNTGNVIPTPTVITDLDESTESELVRFENVYVESVTPTGSSGTNYVLVSGTDTLAMRVDNDTDIDDSLSIVAGDSLCYVIGIGSQRDFGTPALSGYQFLPRTYMDIDTTCGTPVVAAPTPEYLIPQINNVDATTGLADSNGVYCWTRGVVLGINMRPSGLQFTIWDNEGLGVFNGSGNLGYTVTEGDSIRIRGTISQFNGLTQINPDSIQLLNSGNTIPSPVVVTTLDESTESSLVTFENAVVVDTDPGSSGSNYTLTNGTDTITMRVDADTDIDGIFTIEVGDEFCSVTGIGGQFDNSDPRFDGYQLLPRGIVDIDTLPCAAVPTYPIADINNVDANGVADSAGVLCWTEGVVLGVNMRPSGLQFTIWDIEGIGIFNGSGDLGYTVTEGDLVRVRGTVSQFNGLTQINPEEVVLVSSNNTIPDPTVVTTLSEDTESELVRVNDVKVVEIDSSSSAINYTLVNATDSLTMRVDFDTDVEDVWSLSIDDSLCFVIGIGGQFDNSSPYTSGYQLFPRTSNDLDTISCKFNNIEVLSSKGEFEVYPNPVSGSELFFNQVVDITVFNTTGKVVLDAKQVNRIAVDQFNAGVYIIRTANADVVKVVVR